MYKICSIILICACTTVHAQINLVKNPSFEEYTQCPDDISQIKFSKYWTAIDSLNTFPTNTPTTVFDCAPEYCNVCSNYIGIKVPNGSLYYQYPRTGNGMVQVKMYRDTVFSNTSYMRDYLQGRLTTPLVAGKSYCISFYTVLEEGSEIAIQNIGAYLDGGQIDTTTYCILPQTKYTPQIVSSQILADTQHWTKIEGNFIANGSEKFITIGNFKDNLHTNILYTGFTSPLSGYSFYLIDDVSVIPSDVSADAGPDRLIGVGDSTFIGRTPEVGLECKWFIGSTQVGTGAGIWVKPAQTTSYIVEQTLCGLVKKDTVVVYVVPAGVKGLEYARTICNYSVVPNPNQGNFILLQSILHNEFTEVNIIDATGRVVEKRNVQFCDGRATLHVSCPAGIYWLKLQNQLQTQVLKLLVQ